MGRRERLENGSKGCRIAGRSGGGYREIRPPDVDDEVVLSGDFAWIGYQFDEFIGGDAA
jgi:hypothetical protein